MADSGILEIREGAEPASPAANYHRIYVDSSDGIVKHKDEAGTVTLLDLAASGVTPGTYGSASNVSQVTVNTYGQITAATDVPITAASVGAQPLDATLTSLAAYNTNGLVTQTAADTFTGRSITAGHPGIAILNGDGVSANPSVGLNETSINHNNLSNFDLNKHIDHTAVNINPGTGMTGGGDISASRTLSIADTAVTAGSYYSPRSLTVNAQGQITDIKNFDPNFETILFDDWISNTSAGNSGWATANAGTGSASSMTTTGVNSTYRAHGVVQLVTGSTAAGRASLILGTANMVCGHSEITVVINAGFSSLSSGTERFQCTLGLGDDTGATVNAQQTDGIYFRYDDAVSSNWIIETSQASTRTSTTTSVAVSNTQFQELKFVVNYAGSSVEFFIDGISVGTIATNLPGAGQYFAPIIKIMKSIGTTSRPLYVDYFLMRNVWPVSR